jgi:hypothetical protein
MKYHDILLISLIMNNKAAEIEHKTLFILKFINYGQKY